MTKLFRLGFRFPFLAVFSQRKITAVVGNVKQVPSESIPALVIQRRAHDVFEVFSAAVTDLQKVVALAVGIKADVEDQ